MEADHSSLTYKEFQFQKNIKHFIKKDNTKSRQTNSEPNVCKLPIKNLFSE